MKGSIASITAWAALLAPLALWALVWAGIQPGEIRLLLHYESPELLFTRSRALFPLVGGFLALSGISVYIYRRKPRGFSLFGPLGLSVVYGLTGLIATLSSPNVPLALYWGGLYLAVPLVLLTLVWGLDGLRRASQLLTFNFIVIAVLVSVFFIIALQQLGLGGQLLSPDTWSNCRLVTPWFGLNWGPFGFLPFSDGLLRPTGVGRFAALAGIISLGALLGSRWKVSSDGKTITQGLQETVLRVVPWAGFLGMSFLLLWTSGARTAILGFLAAAILVLLLYGGKRAIIGGGIAAVIVVSSALLTGTPQSLVRHCIVYSAYEPGTSLLREQAPAPTSEPEIVAPAESSLETDTQAPSAITQTSEQVSTGTTPSSPTPEKESAGAATSATLPSPTPEKESAGTTASATLPSPTPEKESVGAAASATLPSPTPEKESAGTTASATLPSPTPEKESAGAAASATLPSPTPEKESAGTTTSATLPSPTPEKESAGTTASATLPSPTPEKESAGAAASATLPSPTPEKESAGTTTSATLPSTTIDEGGITEGFFAFSGRSVVWSAAWDKALKSPVLGYGFHSDRLLLGTHMHNSYLHALLQAGFLGVLPFVAVLALTWILLLRALRSLDTLPGIHKHLVIQSAGVLLFFSIRTIPESTLAFFGIDYLLLAPFLLYLQFINSSDRLTRIPEPKAV